MVKSVFSEVVRVITWSSGILATVGFEGGWI
jgi:hypothetical protein